jgi:hypothetical protein
MEPYSREIRNLVNDLHTILGSEKFAFIMQHAEDPDEISQNLFGVDYRFLVKKMANIDLDIPATVIMLAEKHIYPRDIKTSITNKKMNGSIAKSSSWNKKRTVEANSNEYRIYKNPQSVMLDYSPDMIRKLEAEVMLDARNRKMMKEFGQWKRTLTDRVYKRNYSHRYNETHHKATDLMSMGPAEEFKKIAEDMSDTWRAYIEKANLNKVYDGIDYYGKLVGKLIVEPKQVDKELISENDYRWAFAISTAMLGLKKTIGYNRVKDILTRIYT